MKEKEFSMSIFVAAIVLTVAVAAGASFLYVQKHAVVLNDDILDENLYERKSFVTQDIPDYNITIDTQLPQIVKNPVWGTPIKIYIDETEARRRRLADRPVGGLRKAMNMLENVTGGKIMFEEVDNPESADVIARFTFNFSGGEIHEEILGQAGPTLFQRAGEFTLIKKGELYLLPIEYECTSYTLAMHEMGHVLGFGHSKIYNSVMWPRFGCLTNNLSEIIHDVDELYRHYKPDILVSRASAVAQGNLVSINADIANEGPANAEGVKVIVYFDGTLMITENIEKIDTGYSVNMKSLISGNVKEISLEVVYPGEELTKENNAVVMVPE